MGRTLIYFKPGVNTRETAAWLLERQVFVELMSPSRTCSTSKHKEIYEVQKFK